jgi:tetratricopeptide (TPR) repeat protein
LLAQALRDLDQRTSDVEKLPDGRTKFGTVITGQPKAVIEAFGLAVQSYTNRDYARALNQARTGIEAFEASTVEGSLVSGEITPNAKGILYRIAGHSAQCLGSNILANQYAEKAVVVDPIKESRLLLATTLANLGSEKLRESNGPVSLNFFSKAIDAYEASRNIENNQTGSSITIDGNRIYSSAFTTAWSLGSNALALEFAEKAANSYPTNHLNQIRLAVALGRVGRKNEGVALIDRTYGADTNNPEAIGLKETIRAGFPSPR